MKTKFYMHNTAVDVALTQVIRETNYFHGFVQRTKTKICSPFLGLGPGARVSSKYILKCGLFSEVSHFYQKGFPEWEQEETY